MSQGLLRKRDHMFKLGNLQKMSKRDYFQKCGQSQQNTQTDCSLKQQGTVAASKGLRRGRGFRTPRHRGPRRGMQTKAVTFGGEAEPNWRPGRERVYWCGSQSQLSGTGVDRQRWEKGQKERKESSGIYPAEGILVTPGIEVMWVYCAIGSDTGTSHFTVTCLSGGLPLPWETLSVWAWADGLPSLMRGRLLCGQFFLGLSFFLLPNCRWEKVQGTLLASVLGFSKETEPTGSISVYMIVLYLLLFSLSIVPDSLRPHGLRHSRLPCPLPSPGACSNSCQLSWYTVQPPRPLLSPSPPAFNLSQHQGLSQWLFYIYIWSVAFQFSYRFFHIYIYVDR